MPKIVINKDEVSLEPVPEDTIAISKGEAPKSFLSDGRHLYILKKPKKRTFTDIFGESFPLLLAEYRLWTLDDFRLSKDKMEIDAKELLTPYALHLNDLLLEAAFGEVLYQLIGQTLFESFEATESYLHIDSETGEPGIISKFRLDFNEFVEKKLQVAVKTKMMSAKDWDAHPIPSREALDFNPQENYLLGKLYAVALITNDWDLVNNIMLSNSGCIGATDSAEKIMVVDGGNKFHFGFGGLTCDESANLNIAFNPSSTKTHPLTGYDHAVPFDDIAYHKLPRQLIPGLFDLSNPDLFRGFKKIIGEARATLATNPSCIRQAINKATLFITADSHEESIKRLYDPKSTLINHSYYCPSKESDYSLDSVLKARCHFLQVTCAKIEAKISVDQIDLDSLQQYKQSQLSPLKPLYPVCLLEPVLPDTRLCLAV